MNGDPYKTLGVSPSASDEEVRSAYRRMVQLHHPDHNQGSAESEKRFEEVQEAYAEIRKRRQAGPRRTGTTGRTGRTGRAGARTRSGPGNAPPPPADPAVESQLADLERQVRDAAERARRQAEKIREEARRAAREATERATTSRGSADETSDERPSDEELGYIHTDDSFSKILSDARAEIGHRVSDAREHPVVKRVSDLIEGLDDLASKLDRNRRSGPRR